MKKCVIFAGGEICSKEFFEQINFSDSFIICADSGYNIVEKAGAKPDLVVGDFDSIERIPTDVEVVKFPPEKDDTDTMIAVKMAIEKGFTDFEIYGALGKRFDHSFGNLQVLAYLKEYNCNGKLISENEIIQLIVNEEITLNRIEGYSLSVFSYSDKSVGVREVGTKYLVEDAELSSTFPLGISNEIVDDIAIISVKNGKLLIVQSRYQ